MYIKNISKNKWKCCPKFDFYMCVIEVEMIDNKNIKTYFFISIISISIRKIQTIMFTSKTWAKTRGNAAQNLNFTCV